MSINTVKRSTTLNKRLWETGVTPSLEAPYLIWKGGINTVYLFGGMVGMILMLEMLAVLPDNIMVTYIVTVFIIGCLHKSLNSNNNRSLTGSIKPLGVIKFGDLGIWDLACCV